MIRRTALTAFLTLTFAATHLLPLFASAAPSIKRSKSDRDINAIGHRDVMHREDPKVVGSLKKEKERGAAGAVAVERSTKLIHDPALTGYLSALAQNLAQNSDAQMLITVDLIDSDDVNACTSPGGYQYITRGLLLRLESEGELAAVLAHGIAHTVLHTPTMQAIRQTLLSVSSVNPMQNSTFAWFTCTAPPLSIFNGMRRTDEFDADYFGVQYLYKAGYDADGYVRFVQRIWAAPLSANGSDVLAFSGFPTVSDRVKALRHEIADILPPRREATVSTSVFDEFEENLHIWRTGHPEPQEAKQPVLRRADADK